jgi:hypothetical protein
MMEYGAAVPPVPPRAPTPPGLVEAWRRSLFEPVRFFRELDPEGSMARAVLYYLVVSVLASLFSTLWSLPRAETALPPGLLETVPVDPRALMVFNFFLSPFFALAGLGIGVLLTHLFVRILVPGARPVGATARAICWSAGPVLLSIVPWVGSLVGLVWWAVLQVIGLRELHGTTTGRAVAVVALPAVLVLLLLLGLVVMALALAGTIGELPVPR